MSLKNACMLVGLLLLAASPALARKWTDSTGQYSVEAELAGVKGDDVLLKKPDGSIVPVPISRLSDADRRYLEHLNKQTGETQGRLKTEQERPPGVAEPRPFAKEPRTPRCRPAGEMRLSPKSRSCEAITNATSRGPTDR